eukprot:11163208-Lingulodinium_polyedra.AAC.1
MRRTAACFLKTITRPGSSRKHGCGVTVAPPTAACIVDMIEVQVWGYGERLVWQWRRTEGPVHPKTVPIRVCAFA